MSVRNYRYQGVNVLSDREIPVLSHFATSPDESPCDVRIRFDDRETKHLEDDFTLEIRDVATFTVRGLREIIVVPNPAASLYKVHLFLTGSVWGALMYRRGALIMHASAVCAGSGAAAFCAKSGSGKSTLAAVLSAEGYPLISDDLCCVRLSREGPAMVYPSIPRLKLWRDAVEELGWKPREKEDDHSRPGKYLYVKREADCLSPVPLRALYILGWGAAGISRLTGFHAITRLLAAATWRGDLLIAAGNPEAHFAQCSELLKKVECWEFRRPRDLAQLTENTHPLLLHLSENGKENPLCF